MVKKAVYMNYRQRGCEEQSWFPVEKTKVIQGDVLKTGQVRCDFKRFGQLLFKITLTTSADVLVCSLLLTFLVCMVYNSSSSFLFGFVLLF